MTSEDDFIEEAASTQSETATVDFKRAFDPSSTEHWCEVMKDVVAMANSGGGIILFGVEDDGQPTGANVSGILDIDPAKIVDKVYKYTDCQFEGVQVIEATRKGRRVAALRIQACPMPMVFTKTGNYQSSNGKHKHAFQKGVVYFRHGAKSEPGSRDDLRGCIERKVEALRDAWLENIRKVVEAPVGSQIVLMPPDQTEGALAEMPIRVVESNVEDVPTYHKVNPDLTHPYRQTEFVEAINKCLPDDVEINRHDALCLNVVHSVKDDPTYCHHPRFATAQYSDALVDWVIAQYDEDDAFFKKNRRRYYAIRHGSNEPVDDGNRLSDPLS